MKKIALQLEGKDGLKQRLIKNDKFQHHTGYQINVFPFKTQPGGYAFKADFKSFQGVMGETLRIIQKKELDKQKDFDSYRSNLKNNTINRALSKVETSEKDKLENILTTVYFDENNGLYKYNFFVISYMNFISGNAAIKDIPFFISDIFLGDNELFKRVLSGDREDDHLLNQLISDCLPDLVERKEAKREKQIYSNLLPVITDLFQSDLDFLLSDKQYFLENFELFFKYYYFFYFTQLAIKLDDFGAVSFKLKPVYFTMEWENLSESRISLHKNGWKHIHKNYERIFAHANALELLNYITVEGTSPGDYEDINLMYNTFSQDEKITFGECLDVLMTFYKERVNTLNPDASWQSCEEQLQESLIGKDYKEYFTKKMYSFWYLIKYQFENGKRKKPYTDYAQWLITFTKENFTKSAGRYGTKMVLSQEMLLFLTKLCVGKKDKIRLKTFWEELSRRGVAMDETSKSEVVKLFERINLIEKKSDSGDAQYIKSSI